MIRVLLVDDQTLVRKAFKRLLRSEDDVVVIGEASDGREAVLLARELKPDLVLMDIAMEGLNGIEATAMIVAQIPGVRVLALSGHKDEQYVRRALEAGASGYLAKSCEPRELALAIREVARGNTYLDAQVARILIREFAGLEDIGPLRENSVPLSERELAVLKAIADGDTVKDIASTMGVSVKTVESHRSKIMKKLNIHTIAGLTKYAIRNGLSSI